MKGGKPVIVLKKGTNNNPVTPNEKINFLSNLVVGFMEWLISLLCWGLLILPFNLKVRYIHSEVDTLERIEIIRDLRLGKIEVLIGINLLREGLDIPECALVAVLDADKEGYLRSKTSLIQTICYLKARYTRLQHQLQLSDVLSKF